MFNFLKRLFKVTPMYVNMNNTATRIFNNVISTGGINPLVNQLDSATVKYAAEVLKGVDLTDKEAIRAVKEAVLWEAIIDINKVMSAFSYHEQLVINPKLKEETGHILQTTSSEDEEASLRLLLREATAKGMVKVRDHSGAIASIPAKDFAGFVKVENEIRKERISNGE